MDERTWAMFRSIQLGMATRLGQRPKTPYGCNRTHVHRHWINQLSFGNQKVQGRKSFSFMAVQYTFANSEEWHATSPLSPAIDARKDESDIFLKFHEVFNNNWAEIGTHLYAPSQRMVTMVFPDKNMDAIRIGRWQIRCTINLPGPNSFASW